ncbi:SprT family protein [Leuconostocaceae bacterium ESL0723]|nr:SprT family protein [Leuconostocaceae bacterium ESL0723]
MTDDQLQTYVEQLSQTYFGRPFTHRATFNHRLRTTGGRYLLANHNLEFNPKMQNLPAFAGIVKHELCHYHLHLLGRGYRHRDADFKALLKQVGGDRYAPTLANQSQKNYWHYRCAAGHDLYRRRRINTKRYVCGQCHQPLTLVGQVSAAQIGGRQHA